MNHANIFQPVIVMIALTFSMALWMLRLRFKAVGEGKLSPEYFKLNQGGKPPQQLIQVTQHFDNLLELPTLFYAVCVIAYVMGSVDAYLLTLAWAFVVMRLLHSAIHTTYNHILHRMLTFLASCAVLGMMWVDIGIQVFTSA